MNDMFSEVQKAAYGTWAPIGTQELGAYIYAAYTCMMNTVINGVSVFILLHF